MPDREKVIMGTANMEDKKQVMSWLEGLAQDDWPMYHSDSEVQEIAKNALELLEEQPEIVRCKDCRKNMMCEMTIHKPKDWFCADGKGREENA